MRISPWLPVLCAVFLAGPGAFAQEDESKFEKQSVAFRTALFYDPSLDAPLEKLLELYRGTNRVDELLDIYHGHTLQFPEDAGARVVRLRLLLKLRKPEIEAALRKAVEDFPDSSLIRRVEYEQLGRQRDPRALDALSEAISKEMDPARKRQWTEELVKAAGLEDRGDLAKKHLDEILGGAMATPESLLAVARQLHGARFHLLALKALERALAGETAPETRVDVVLLAAKAESALGNYDKAQDILTSLLEKVAPDYWRRREIVTLRIHLVQSDAEREKLLRKARAEFEMDKAQESAALDLGALLVASDLRKEAIEVLDEALAAAPHSAVLEREILALYDRLNDAHGAKDFLQRRLEAAPGRVDLTYRLVKAMFVTGEPVRAKEALAKMLAELDEDARFERQLDLARYLRRMSSPRDAALVFNEAMQARPERLDVRRELAETYLSTGKRASARALFTDELAAESTIENFLDVAQFLVGQEMLGTAKRVLVNRRQVEPDHFELRLLLVDVLGKLGEKGDGDSLLLDSRELADTEARYRRWLETGVNFQALFGTEARFFDDEQRRLTSGEGDAKDWSPKQIARFYAFCEVAGRNSQKERAVDAIRSQLADPGLDAEWRTRLRQLLVDAIQRDPGSETEVQEQLNSLIRDDPDRVASYQAKLASLYHQWGRTDLAKPLLEKLDFAKVDDAALASTLSTICFEYSLGEMGLAALERAIELDPSNRAAWENWIAALAAVGDEARLRTALRQIISGVDRMPVSEETRTLLNLHLADSHWRSIAAILAEPDRGGMAEVLPLIDAVERVNVDPMDILWAKWAKAFVNGRLGRESAHERAIADLESALISREESEKNDEPAPEPKEGEAESEGEKSGDGERLLHFPDGLATSVNAGISLLRGESLDADVDSPVVSQGPTSALAMDWVFDTDRNAKVARVIPLSESRIFVLDVGETGYLIDSATGKMLWRRSVRVYFESGESAELGAKPQPNRNQYYGGTSFRMPISVASDGKGNLVFGKDGVIRAVDAETGAARWGAHLRGRPLIMTRPGYSHSLWMELDASGHLLAWDPVRASAACLDTVTGKLIWERNLGDLSGESAVSAAQWAQRHVNETNTGCSYDNGYFFVYGAETAILNAATGNVIWTFRDGKIRRLPLRLKEPEDNSSLMGFLGGGALGAMGPSMFPGGLVGGSFGSSMSYPGMAGQKAVPINHLMPRTQRVNFMQSMTLNSGYTAAPAAVWAGQLRSGQNSFGFVAGENLALKPYNNTFSIYSLALPLGARETTMDGAFVGSLAGRACFLNIGKLTIEGMKAGRNSQLPLDSVKTGEMDEVQATIDGARVYVCGGAGMMGVSLLSGRRIFEYPWPQPVLDLLQGEGGEDGSPATQSQAPSYMPRGVVLAPAANAALQLVSRFSSRSSYRYQPPRQDLRWILPMRVAIGNNRLFFGTGDRVISMSGTEMEGVK